MDCPRKNVQLTMYQYLLGLIGLLLPAVSIAQTQDCNNGYICELSMFQQCCCSYNDEFDRCLEGIFSSARSCCEALGTPPTTTESNSSNANSSGQAAFVGIIAFVIALGAFLGVLVWRRCKLEQLRRAMRNGNSPQNNQVDVEGGPGPHPGMVNPAYTIDNYFGQLPPRYEDLPPLPPSYSEVVKCSVPGDGTEASTSQNNVPPADLPTVNTSGQPSPPPRYKRENELPIGVPEMTSSEEQPQNVVSSGEQPQQITSSGEHAQDSSSGEQPQQITSSGEHARDSSSGEQPQQITSSREQAQDSNSVGQAQIRENTNTGPSTSQTQNTLHSTGASEL